jgi:hypothetical protein
VRSLVGSLPSLHPLDRRLSRARGPQGLHPAGPRGSLLGNQVFSLVADQRATQVRDLVRSPQVSLLQVQQGLLRARLPQYRRANRVVSQQDSLQDNRVLSRLDFQRAVRAPSPAGHLRPCRQDNQRLGLLLGQQCVRQFSQAVDHRRDRQGNPAGGRPAGPLVSRHQGRPSNRFQDLLVARPPSRLQDHPCNRTRARRQNRQGSRQDSQLGNLCQVLRPNQQDSPHLSLVSSQLECPRANRQGSPPVHRWRPVLPRLTDQRLLPRRYHRIL